MVRRDFSCPISWDRRPGAWRGSMVSGRQTKRIARTRANGPAGTPQTRRPLLTSISRRPLSGRKACFRWFTKLSSTFAFTFAPSLWLRLARSKIPLGRASSCSQSNAPARPPMWWQASRALNRFMRPRHTGTRVIGAKRHHLGLPPQQPVPANEIVPPRKGRRWVPSLGFTMTGGLRMDALAARPSAWSMGPSKDCPGTRTRSVMADS